ncbi:hypothetical protein CCS01_16615 [Rhodopila globiformis]|uniref:Uncharacterized protein n=1 Tax=Rhodopila globiformis TaxID=1071 RepID=A0A2S6NB44_RHOGL|nr:hypothetical protein CCS01_16615 [Rhodopila globiformis]
MAGADFTGSNQADTGFAPSFTEDVDIALRAKRMKSSDAATEAATGVTMLRASRKTLRSSVQTPWNSVFA